MEFREISFFLALCDAHSFTKAAEACNVSQPALTKAIQRLEEKLGNSLILRGGGRFELTELGRVMHIHFKRIDETRKAARRAAQAISENRPEQLDIGIMCTVGPALIGPALAAFQQKYMDIELLLHDVTTSTGYELLRAGAVDCTLMGCLAPVTEEFTAVPLYAEPMVLAMTPGHPLASKSEIFLADLNGSTYADRLACEFQNTFFEILANRELNVQTVIRSEREEWIQVAVAHGHGLSIIPQHAIVTPGIISKRIVDMNVERQVECITMKEPPESESLKSLLGFLGDYRWL